MVRPPLALLALLLAAPCAALEVPLTVREPVGVARAGEPVTSGVPLPKGAVKDVAKLGVKGPIGAVPAQFRALSSWPDGSVRWVLADFQADVAANGEAVYTLVDRANGAKAKQPLKVEDGAETITLTTGGFRVVVGKKRFDVLHAVELDGKPLLAAGPGAVLRTVDGRDVALADRAPDEVVVEEQGPLRVVVRASGLFGDLNGDKVRWICRITAHAGQPVVGVRFWLRNLGAYGYNIHLRQTEWFPFDGMCLRLPLAPLAGEAPLAVACEGVDAQVAAQGAWLLDQQGERPDGSFRWTITADGAALKSGERSAGVVAVSGAHGRLIAAQPRFWQNYEKAVGVDGRDLSIWLWPTTGEWPRTAVSRGATDEGPRAPSVMHLPGGMQKGHEVVLDFRPAGDALATAARAAAPLAAVAKPEWYADCEAFGTFAPAGFRPADAAAAGIAAQLETWSANCWDPAVARSIPQSRESGKWGFWYGWLDFGDMCWPSAAEGPCQLHYDWTWMACLGWMRQGDRHAFDRAGEMARHLMDIDQRWSDRDHEVYRGLCQFEMAYADIGSGTNDGRMTPIPSHNWISGLIAWHLLTGDEMAKEAALRNCDVGLKLRLVDPLAAKPDERQPRESGWGIENLVAAYDLTGDAKYLEWAKVCWTNHLEPMWRKNGPQFSAGKFGLQMFYCTHGLIDLHRATGEASILEYIRDATAKIDAARDQWDYGNELGAFVADWWGYLAVVEGKPELLAKAREYYAMRVHPTDQGQIDPHEAPLPFAKGTGATTKEVGKVLRNGHYWLAAERRFAGAKPPETSQAPSRR